MIVPLIFECEEYIKEKPAYLWVFYKFANFALKANTPIIATNEYFKKPSFYREKGHSGTIVMDYYSMNDETYKKIKKEEIDKKKITKKYKNNLDAWLSLLSKRDKDLEKELERIIIKIEKENEKIDAFMIWTWIPSIAYVAKKHNIRVINQEGSAIRQPFYTRLLNYFQFQNKYDCTGLQEGYEKISKEEIFCLSRKEIFALLLDKNNINFLREIENEPIYELGYALGVATDCFGKVYSKTTQDEILKNISKLVDTNKICVRTHPKEPVDVESLGYISDTSASSFEWIIKCKRVVSDLSNIGFESLLVGRSIISLSDKMPSSFGKISSLDYIDDEVMNIKKLNYLLFCWFTPEELTQDVKYVNWRLTNPEPKEIYNKNLNYILKDINSSINELKKIEPKDRLKYILEKRKIDYNSVFYSTEENKNKKSLFGFLKRGKV